MKTFIVLAAVIAVAAAGAVRNTGWGSPSPPQIDLELSGAAAAVGAGQGAASQQLLETASGGPASISSANGVLVSVNQGEEIVQVGLADLNSGATSTLQAIEVGNQAIALDALDATLNAVNSVGVTNSAATSSSGEGAIAAEGNTYSATQTKK